MQSQQNPYQAPDTQQSSTEQVFAQSQNPPVVKTEEWGLFIFLAMIPLVNIIALLIWASSSTTNPNKKNFAIALLTIMGILIVVFMLLLVVLILASSKY